MDIIWLIAGVAHWVEMPGESFWLIFAILCVADSLWRIGRAIRAGNA